jgi:uncharacterized protein (UPF0261 family)
MVKTGGVDHYLITAVEADPNHLDPHQLGPLGGEVGVWGDQVAAVVTLLTRKKKANNDVVLLLEQGGMSTLDFDSGPYQADGDIVHLLEQGGISTIDIDGGPYHVRAGL